MAEFKIADLRDWRKKYRLSQEKFAELANLGINTVIKIESGKHQVQAQTMDKILAAVKSVESKSSAPAAAPSVAVTPAVATTTPNDPKAQATASAPTISTPLPNFAKAYNPVLLSNLDVELIHRILSMTGLEKIKLLESLMS